MRQCMKHVVLAFAVAALVSPAQARVSVNVTEWGETAGVRGEQGPPAFRGNGLAPAKSFTGVTYLTHTDTIIGRLCGNFGITVQVAATPGEAVPDQLQVVVHHPEMTRPDGATSAADAFDTVVDGGVAHVGFGFENPWEVVPGPWRIDILSHGEARASKDFTIVPPPPGTPNSVCKGKPVS